MSKHKASKASDVVVSDQGDRVQGTVKWFNDVKGYGFITMGDGTSVFVHFSEIQMEGHKKLEENQQVEFSLGKTQKGPCAVGVTPL